jgi:hypothetical protein
MSEREWFRNAGAGKYHQAAPGWIRTGLAVCGRDIKNPTHVARDLHDAQRTEAFGYGPCKLCVKKAAVTDAR